MELLDRSSFRFVLCFPLDVFDNRNNMYVFFNHMPGLKKEKEKTPSQRLRTVLYIYWEQNFKNKYPEFEDYYLKQMESITKQFKNKLK